MKSFYSKKKNGNLCLTFDSDLRILFFHSYYNTNKTVKLKKWTCTLKFIYSNKIQTMNIKKWTKDKKI